MRPILVLRPDRAAAGRHGAPEAFAGHQRSLAGTAVPVRIREIDDRLLHQIFEKAAVLRDFRAGFVRFQRRQRRVSRRVAADCGQRVT